MGRYNNDPREIRAKFASICPETGKQINKGDRIVYFPRERKAFHVDSKSAQDWLSQAAADYLCLGDAGW
jgi:hypothetical protein